MSSWKSNYIVLDTETTGIGPEARIVEIAFARFAAGKRVETWTTFVNPGDVDWNAQAVIDAMAVNRISRADLIKAPSFHEIAEQVVAQLGKASVVVAHNFEFDWRMLKQEWEKIPDDHPAKKASVAPPNMMVYVDTMLGDFGLNPGKRKRRLELVCARWGVQHAPTHRALDDAIACGELMVQMRELLPDSQEAVCLKMDRWSKEWRRMFEQRRAANGG